MRAVQLMETGRLETRTVPDPTPAPGEIVISVEAAGICGTDRHLFKGEFPSVPGKTLGHEFSGRIVDAGDTGLPLDARITADPNIWCGTCPPCRRGRVNLCENNVAIGIARDGGFAEFCALPARQAHLLPETLDPLFGAFCEPLACTLHGVDIGAPRPGERVIVIGGGVIGLLAVQLAVRAGAEVMLLTRSAAKQDLGLSMGAAHTAPDPEAARAIWADGADLILECAGVPETVAMAPALARVGGRVVVLGVLPQGVQVEIEPFDLLFREIDLRFSFLNPFTHGRARDLICSGAIDVRQLVSRTLTLEDTAAAIAHPARAGEVRAIVQPGGVRSEQNRLD